MTETVRLNKWMAECGACSRREADRLIEDGQVTVNGKKVTALGSQIDPQKDTVRLNGKVLQSIPKYYLLFHKPKGCITTRSDEMGRKTIYDFIPDKWLTVDPAGRLDRNSTGALILSNDGDFIYQLTHPKFHLPKVYRVTVTRPLTPEAVQSLLDGIMLEPEGKLAKAKTIELDDPVTMKMTLVTGYNRQIRRCLEALGYEVNSLKRLSIGPIRLGDLKPGDIRMLSLQERRQLQGAFKGGEKPKRFAGSKPQSKPKFKKRT